jgi:hypothetical protein
MNRDPMRLYGFRIGLLIKGYEYKYETEQRSFALEI